MDLYLPEKPQRTLHQLWKEIDDTREKIFKSMCDSSGLQPKQLATLPLEELRQLAERVTKLTFPDPSKIHSCLIEYINGLENS